MHSHHSSTPVSLGREILQSVPVFGQVFSPHHQTKLQVMDAMLLDAAEIGGELVGMYVLPGLSSGSVYDMDMTEEEMENMKMTYVDDAEMAAKMLLGGAAGRVTYSLVSKPIKELIQCCYPEGGLAESWGSWFKKKILGSTPFIGPFFWADTKLGAIAYNISHVTMILAGTAAMVLALEPKQSMSLEPEDVAITGAVMLGGMQAAHLLMIPARRTLASCLSHFGLWSTQDKGRSASSQDASFYTMDTEGTGDPLLDGSDCDELEVFSDDVERHDTLVATYRP